MAKARETALVTIAHIREGKQGTEYLFNERQQIFRLAEGAADTRRMLKTALEGKRPLKVALNAERATIEKIDEAGGAEIEAFKRAHPLEAKPQKSVAIDVAKIDPLTFNFAEAYLKSPLFSLCTKTVPSYAKAKEIFDYCAGLSCHLGGVPATPPCIPFQYVIDGCYARAHQMRRIITKKYGYCCEKVFSYGYANSDTLAVKADKWGGCCVFWWYHVAPLIRVKFKLKGFPSSISFQLAMVIDPGMFDKPVLLSTWLQAQENTTCSPHAHITSYSIQPGSAYTPSYPPGSYATDPNYTATEATLIAYKNLTTC